MSYDMIDRFLRNNLGDDDYAEYSAALDSLCAPQREWQGLTRKEMHDLYDSDYAVFYQRIEAKLKQKNGYAEEKNA